MKTEKILLGKLLDGEYRAIVYRREGHTTQRYVINFMKQTFMEILYYLETTFSFAKEEIEYV